MAIPKEEVVRAWQLWTDFGKEWFARLQIEMIPLYIPVDRNDVGISIVQARYKNKKGNIQTEWVRSKLWKKKKQLIAWCQWTFLPVAIDPRKRSALPEDHLYWYLIKAEQGEAQEGAEPILMCHMAKIATAGNGMLLKKVDATTERGEKLSFKYKFAFPRQVMSKINKCFANNFLPQYWTGPPCAAWHRTDEGRAFYLGIRSRPPKNPKLDQLLNLMNGPNGDAASILLAYSCFSMLKPFFPSYHMLYKDDSYFEVKNRLPEQIAINVQSDHLTDAERLVDICCGYFRRFKASKESKRKAMPITDGIAIQKSPPELKKLGVNEFERKVVQPACVLWVNREPAIELIESGNILNVHISSSVEDDVESILSETLVYALAFKVHEQTTRTYEKRFNEDWTESVPKIEYFLNRLNECAISLFGEDSQESSDILDELIKFRQDRSNPKEPLSLLKQIRYRIISEVRRIIEELLLQDPTIVPKLKDYHDEIQKSYTDCMREMKKIHKRNMRLFYSLDSAYSENVKKLVKNQSVSLLGQEAAKKIAYLSISFQAFSQAAIPSEYRQGLCDRVEASLITAYRRQLDVHLPQKLLENYILGLLEKGQCARVRGENSHCDHIRVWYDDRDSIFLICSKGYFDKLNSPIDISKRDFENALVNAGILCTVPRKNQERRTFEVVVQKGRGRVSVLKIKAESLSDKFSENARKHLEQIKNDKTSYRS